MDNYWAVGCLKKIIGPWASLQAQTVDRLAGLVSFSGALCRRIAAEPYLMASSTSPAAARYY